MSRCFYRRCWRLPNTLMYLDVYRQGLVLVQRAADAEVE
jgi:hypothetical protein